jgi:cation:H+ antiporter
VANILLILGTSGLIKPLTMGGIAELDIWMVPGVAILLLLSALAIGQRRITRVEGIAYLAIYVGYVLLLMK